MSTEPVHTIASATRVFSGTFHGRTLCLTAYNLTLPLLWSASRTNHRPLLGCGFLVGDRVGGKLPVCHIESGQALRNEACPVAKPMHVDAAAVRFSLRDHHARKLVAIFRNLRESRPDCG